MMLSMDGKNGQDGENGSDGSRKLQRCVSVHKLSVLRKERAECERKGIKGEEGDGRVEHGPFNCSRPTRHPVTTLRHGLNTPLLTYS